MRRPTFVRSLFFAALGGVYLIAFRSLGSQVKGLYGSRGIRPIAGYLDALRPNLAPRERLRYVPSIFWFDASDATLVRACQAGQVGAVLLALRILPRTTATALWALYLSFVSTGRDFLSFQWDVLLLENGLHAIVLAPSRRGSRPPHTAVALMRWLAFRLQFESGHCKLASGDPTWRNGDACTVHFETQPLPTKLAWYTHQLPNRTKRGMTYATLAIELGAPWLAFAPRRLRRAGFAILTGLQIIIAATGNYTFFNLLTIVDNLWLLDESPRTRVVRRATRPAWWHRGLSGLAALPIAAISCAQLVTRLFRKSRTPGPIARLEEAVAPFHSVNPYGLFAVMTTDRPEIVIEGSDDAVEWREYGFRYKPGDLQRAPRWAAPHQPRVDWQMWFAALGPAPPWFVRLLERLLEGSNDVLALLENNPFPQRPPRYIRALLYDYHFTDPETRRRTGAWWRRELLGTYVLPLQLAPPDRP
jgi:hypothetical protein